MKLTKPHLKQIIKEELELDSALLDAVKKLTKKIDDLDISIDFLSAAVIGGDTVSIGAGQAALGREYRPRIRSTEPKLEEIAKEETIAVLSEYKYRDMDCDELEAQVDDLRDRDPGEDAAVIENEIDVIENLMVMKGCKEEKPLRISAPPDPWKFKATRGIGQGTGPYDKFGKRKKGWRSPLSRGPKK